MKTRRNRRGGGPFSSFFGSTPAQPAQPAPAQAPPQPAPAQPAQAQPAPVASPVDVQNAVPLGDKELPNALLQEPTPEPPSGNTSVDDAVNQLYHLDKQFQNYHMRGIINAIGVCNTTEKGRNNAAGIGNTVLNTFGRGNESKLEMTQCGTQCKERSEKVKAALKELLRIGEGNDALGYIGSGRVAVNSGAYLYNSGKSLINKFGNSFKQNESSTQSSSTPSNQQNAVGTSMAGTAGTGFFGLFGGKRTRRRR